MRSGYSIRARLMLGAALVLLAFLAGAGVAVQRAHRESVRDNYFSRLQGTIYLLLARAELDDNGELVMPPAFAEPRLSLPQSGLYASIYNVARNEQWRSPSTVGVNPPFRRDGVDTGEWLDETLEGGGHGYLAVSYRVNWAAGKGSGPLVLSVLEDRTEFDHEVAVFTRTLWEWRRLLG